MAVGINDLDLPSFTIPDLFMPHKLVVPTALLPDSSIGASTKNLSPQLFTTEVHDKYVTIKQAPPTNQQGFSVLPFASIEAEQAVPHTPPCSYSSAVQTPPQRRVITPELTSSDSTVSSDGSDDSLPNIRPSIINGKSRRVNPNIVRLLSQT